MGTESADPMRLPLLDLIDSGGLPVTEPRPCAYLPGRAARSEGFRAAPLHGETYHDLMDRGFRRSGDIFYRPRCDGCQACVQIRIPVGEFEPSKSQRRALRRNEEVTVRVGPLTLTEEKAALYQRYLAHQHPGSPQSEDAEGLREFLYQDVVETVEVNYLLGERVIAVSILDVCSRSVSSVYHFFDPVEAGRSLGVFSILMEIEMTKAWNVPHYYLGYWVRGSKTMDYKAKFTPHELLVEGKWVRGESQ